MSGFRTPELPRDQILLWGQRLDDAVPPDHPVRHMELLLRSKAFQDTFSDWERCYCLAEGQPPYHPRDLAALYIYGMMNRLRSSRQLEAACFNRVDVIWLMTGQHPDHATVAGFVQTHGTRLRRLHKDVLNVAVAAGLVRLQHVAYDSTKIAADASKASLHSEADIAAQLAQLDERLKILEHEWQQNEQRESSLLGEEVPWIPGKSDSLNQRLAKMKRQQERLQRALQNIERRREESTHRVTPKALASVSDPDSRMMPSKEGGRRLNYSAHVGVDTAAGVIVAADVNDHSEDSGLLVPLLQQTQESCGHLPQEASADSGYNIGPDLAAMEQMGVTGYLPDNGERSDGQARAAKTLRAIRALPVVGRLTDDEWAALPRDRWGRIAKEAFTYDPVRDAYRCPMGETLNFWTVTRDMKNWGERRRRLYRRRTCMTCPRVQECCQNPARGRTINRDHYEECRARLQARMGTDVGRARFGLRQRTVEPRIGLIKHLLGVRRFQHRGGDAVNTEWLGVCTAVNVGILLRHWQAVQPVL